MNSGLYAALTGAVASTQRLDIIANNLANASTAGFKKDKMSFESLLNATSSPTPNLNSDDPTFAGEIHSIDYSLGAHRQTGNTYDVALEGDGFFVVNTPEGQGYTRQGTFRRSNIGQLVTVDGYPVLGKGAAPITIPPTAAKIDIDSGGGIYADGIQLGTIDIVDFPKPYALQKQGNSIFLPADPNVTPQATVGTRVAQGYVEESNTNTISEMVQMIETTRYYEACTKVIRNFDDVTAKAVNDLGKV
jgi:flagellar basal-body rod protein FlgG